MRVLMISWEYPPHMVGGLGRHVYHLSKQLAAGGVEVEVLTFTDGTSPMEERVDGVDVIRVNPYRLRYPDFVSWIHGLNMFMIKRAAELDDFDLIHVHDWLTASSGIALKNLARRPLVATIHSAEMGRRGGHLSNDSERHIHGLEWWLTYEAWRVICCSNYMLGETARHFGCPRDKIVVITNGYESASVGGGGGWGGEREQISAEREGSTDGGKKIVLYVGRLVYEKGPQTLIQAAKHLSRDDLEYFIVGDGSLKPYLADMTRKLGLEGRVRFLGHVPDSEIETLYRRASVAVFPSLYEPFGIVALEAMGAGIPVIVSAVGGLDEIVSDGYNGLKFQPGSAESLSSVISRAVDDSALRDHIVRNAVASLQKYSWRSAAVETARLYREVLTEYEKGTWKPKEW